MGSYALSLFLFLGGMRGAGVCGMRVVGESVEGKLVGGREGRECVCVCVRARRCAGVGWVVLFFHTPCRPCSATCPPTRCCALSSLHEEKIYQRVNKQPFPPALLLQAMFCHVPANQVLTMHDVSNIWRVPLMMQAQGAHTTICNILGLRWVGDIPGLGGEYSGSMSIMMQAQGAHRHLQHPGGQVGGNIPSKLRWKHPRVPVALSGGLNIAAQGRLASAWPAAERARRAQRRQHPSQTTGGPLQGQGAAASNMSRQPSELSERARSDPAARRTDPCCLLAAAHLAGCRGADRINLGPWKTGLADKWDNLREVGLQHRVCAGHVYVCRKRGWVGEVGGCAQTQDVDTGTAW